MKIAYCTIASANYLPRVHVLEESLLTYNPDASLHILLCEQPDICVNLSKEIGRTLISPSEVCTQWLHMSFYYDIIEYNTALKPFLIEHLLNLGYDAVVYFDPDIEIFGSLHELEALLSSYDLILTPHVCEPMPMDGLTPSIDDIIRAGQFNLGFIGLVNSKESRKALEWWQSVCVEHCLFDARHRFFVDQFWAAALPSFIQKFYCLRSPAYNMAYWNIPQRELRIENNHWITSDRELKFFHFSGLAEDLTQISRYQNRIMASLDSPLYRLLVKYTTSIKTNPWHKYSQLAYSFGHYTNGKSISAIDRKVFLRLSFPERQALGDPFAHPEALHSIQAQVKRLYQEYLATLRHEGLIPAHLAVLRFVVRGLARRLWLIR